MANIVKFNELSGVNEVNGAEKSEVSGVNWAEPTKSILWIQSNQELKDTHQYNNTQSTNIKKIK